MALRLLETRPRDRRGGKGPLWRKGVAVLEKLPKPEHLSSRERQIAEAYSTGQSYREIARHLFIAPSTVRTHLNTIYRKLNVSRKIELLRALGRADGEVRIEAAAMAPGRVAAAPPADGAGRQQVTVLSAMLDRVDAGTRPAPVARPAAPEPGIFPPVYAPTPALPPFVDRDAELTRLHGALAEALEGGRRVVLVTGTPGIGKSALLDAFLASLAERPDLWLARGQCLPQVGPGEPYLPVLEAFGALCQEPGAAPVQAALGRYAPIWLTQLPTLLSEAEMDALQRRVGAMAPERMLRQLAEAVEALTAERVLVLCFDDLQWSDRATLELIDTLARRQPKARLLIVGAYRSTELIGPDHPLLALKQDLQLRGRCAELALEPLRGAAVTAYCAGRFGVDEAPSMRALPRLVHERSGGHPLFMSAITDDLVRRGVIVHQDGRWSAAELMQDLAVPASVRQFIGHEIERLAPEQQQMLEAASVAGLEFSVAAVAAASDADAEAIEARCTDLVRHQRFLRPAGVGEWPDGTVAARFAFRHDLYLEAVSERLGASRRRALHLRIGEWREQAYGGRAKEIAATLAVHFEEAGDWLRAARYCRHASEQAQRRHAPREAAEHARRGVTLIQRVPASAERTRWELLLLQTLAVALITAKSYAAPGLAEVYTRAGELCNEVDDLETLVPVLCGWWALAVSQGDFKRASTVADQLLVLAERRSEPVPLLEAHVVVAQTRFFTGEPVAAGRHVDQCLALYDARHHGHLTEVYGEDPGVVGRQLRGWAQWLVGCPDQARHHSDDGLRLSRELGYPFGIAQALWARAIIDQHCGDVDQVRERAEALIRLCREAEIAYWLGGGRILRGWALARQGRVGPGTAQLRRGLDASRAAGAACIRPYYLALLAEALTGGGAREAALATLAEARALAESTGERWYEAELHRLTGELAWSDGEGATAEAWLQSALEIARRQDAKSWKLRAATSLSRLSRDQGRRAQARDLLTPVYGWFTEGFDTADLKEAKTLLAELA
jgi:predicted ATPase/DNA-binding CsgD family transcriptional regulator